MIVRLGRDLCGEWESASRREWLVTNGLGGFACGTIALANTRRYHAFLMASLAPPVERMLLVAKVDVTTEYLGRSYPLFANEFTGGALDPRGFVHIESFSVQDGVPVWRFALADALLEQRIFMEPGANTSHLSLELKRASAPVRVELKPLVGYRELHVHGRGARPFSVQPEAAACTVNAFEGARQIQLAISNGRYAPVNEWYWNFYHREESARGLDALEDLFVPGLFTAELAVGQAVFFAASARVPRALRVPRVPRPQQVPPAQPVPRAPPAPPVPLPTPHRRSPRSFSIRAGSRRRCRTPRRSGSRRWRPRRSNSSYAAASRAKAPRASSPATLGSPIGAGTR